MQEASENRNYLSGRMSEEVTEMIRVLQLTTYDEEEWDGDNLTAMRRAANAVEGSLGAAVDWLQDNTAMPGRCRWHREALRVIGGREKEA